MSECCTRSRLSLAQAIHTVRAPLQTRSNAFCQLFVGATLQEPNCSKSRCFALFLAMATDSALDIQRGGLIIYCK